jgi:hypothetical protein
MSGWIRRERMGGRKGKKMKGEERIEKKTEKEGKGNEKKSKRRAIWTFHNSIQ